MSNTICYDFYYISRNPQELELQAIRSGQKELSTITKQLDALFVGLLNHSLVSGTVGLTRAQINNIKHNYRLAISAKEDYYKQHWYTYILSIFTTPQLYIARKKLDSLH